MSACYSEASGQASEKYSRTRGSIQIFRGTGGGEMKAFKALVGLFFVLG